MRFVTIILAFFLFVSPAFGDDTTECVKRCLGGDTTPVPVPVPTTKVFPDSIVFDNTSDQGTGIYFGTACVLFPSNWEGKITAVTVNGEQAFHGESYKGRPVFRLTRTGEKYARPLKLVIQTTLGTYTAESGAASQDPGPSGGSGRESAAPTSCGNPDGPGCRQNMRFKHPGSFYGRNIKIYLDGVYQGTVPYGSQRKEFENGLLWKPEGNTGNAVVIGKYGKRYKQCTIVW